MSPPHRQLLGCARASRQGAGVSGAKCQHPGGNPSRGPGNPSAMCQHQALRKSAHTCLPDAQIIQTAGNEPGTHLCWDLTPQRRAPKVGKVPTGLFKFQGPEPVPVHVLRSLPVTRPTSRRVSAAGPGSPRTSYFRSAVRLPARETSVAAPTPPTAALPFPRTSGSERYSPFNGPRTMRGKNSLPEPRRGGKQTPSSRAPTPSTTSQQTRVCKKQPDTD